MLANQIVQVSVQKSEESSGTTFWVVLHNAAEQRYTPESWKTWKPDHPAAEKGLSREAALNRALITAGMWADFLGLQRPTYMDNGVEVKASMNMGHMTEDRLAGNKQFWAD